MSSSSIMRSPELYAIVFHRNGELHLTNRFKDGAMPVLSSDDFVPGAESRVISFSSGANLNSVATVSEIIPRVGDATGRWYTDKSGNNHWIDLPSYALVNPVSYLDFIRTEVPKGVRAWAASQGPVHEEALRLIDTFPAEDLKLLLCYDFGRHQKTRSGFLLGSDTLGIPKLPDQSQTLPGRSPVPRMVTAQCDNLMSIYLSELLEKLFGENNGIFLKRMESETPLDAYISYVACRLIVQGTLWVLIDKVRRDRQNNTTDKSLQLRLQENLNCLLEFFYSSHHGLAYDSIVGQIPKRSIDFLASELAAPTSEAEEEWQNLNFWLSPLHEVLGAKSYQAKSVF